MSSSIPRTSPSAAPLPLNYGSAPPGWRKIVRRLSLALAFVTMAVCVWQWGPNAWRQARLLYWQRQCMTFSAPADMVVYEEEPGAVARLLHVPAYTPYVPPSFSQSASTAQAAAFEPSCWTTLNSVLPPLMRAYVRGYGIGAFIFLHERISPGGHRRLVCLNYAPDRTNLSPSFVNGFNYWSWAFSPATWTTTLTGKDRVYGYDIMTSTPLHPPLVRIFAGQPDPNDPSHFTIRYQMWGQEDVLDGRLLDNDDVSLTPRHLPDWPRN